MTKTRLDYNIAAAVAIAAIAIVVIALVALISYSAAMINRASQARDKAIEELARSSTEMIERKRADENHQRADEHFAFVVQRFFQRRCVVFVQPAHEKDFAVLDFFWKNETRCRRHKRECEKE